MSKQAQKANKDFAELTKKEIRKAGEDEIDKVEKALKAMEPFNDVFEVREACGKINHRSSVVDLLMPVIRIGT